jgi:hypothetical protein
VGTPQSERTLRKIGLILFVGSLALLLVAAVVFPDETVNIVGYASLWIVVHLIFSWPVVPLILLFWLCWRMGRK